MHCDLALNIIMFKMQMNQDANDNEGLRDWDVQGNQASIDLSSVFSPWQHTWLKLVLNTFQTLTLLKAIWHMLE